MVDLWDLAVLFGYSLRADLVVEKLSTCLYPGQSRQSRLKLAVLYSVSRIFRIEQRRSVISGPLSLTSETHW